MFKKQLLLKTGLIFSLFTSGAMYAQTAEVPAVDKPNESKPIEVSGKIFANWHTVLTDSTDAESGEKHNTFQLERIYLTAKKQIDDIFSAQITLDASNEPVIEDAEISDETAFYDANGNGQMDAGEEVEYEKVYGKQTSKYRVFVKNAFVNAKQKVGDISLNFSFGLIGTPVLGLIDKQTDQRWIQKSFIDDARTLLGTSIDNSSDTGASLSIIYPKLLEVAFALTNGEGFKNTNEELFANDSDNTKNTAYGKAYYALATVTPLEQLALSGFCRYEGTSVNESDNHKGYYGASAAWKDKLFTVGANYIIPFQKIDGEDAQVSGTTDKKAMSIAEAWLNVTPEKAIGMPVIFMARYAYGEDANADDSRVTYIGAGLGYKFSKNVRTIAWYNQLDSESADAAQNPNPEKLFSIKAEVSL